MANRTQRASPPATGIFGPDWPKWRGATLELRLADEPPFLARFDAVRGAPPSAGTSAIADHATALLTLLDEQLRPTTARTIPWPPDGTVRVIRAP